MGLNFLFEKQRVIKMKLRRESKMLGFSYDVIRFSDSTGIIYKNEDSGIGKGRWVKS